ncbi:hypothetical protein I6M32_09900, partial [Shewanella algae]|nr:hypothetical protein [Shewanella algae]
DIQTDGCNLHSGPILFPDDFQQLHRGPLRGRLKGDGSIPLSMMPMQMALSTLLRHNRSFSEIKRALLLESAAGKISLVGASMDALHSVAPVELEHIVVSPEPN